MVLFLKCQTSFAAERKYLFYPAPSASIPAARVATTWRKKKLHEKLLDKNTNIEFHYFEIRFQVEEEHAI